MFLLKKLKYGEKLSDLSVYEDNIKKCWKTWCGDINYIKLAYDTDQRGQY